MIVCAALAALALATSQHGHHHHRRQPAGRTPVSTAQRPAAAETAAQRRIARMLRLAQLEQRERRLHDFVVRARTETPSFFDAQTQPLASGLEVGPTLVTRDFLGSPIIRAQVHNSLHRAIVVVLQAHIAADHGRIADAAIAVSLGANERRSVELLCPSALTPATLRWTATIL